MKRVPVTDRRHAELHALVLDTAERADLVPPPELALGGRAIVTVRGDVLLLGLPLVWGLSADQLRAVIAHELALPKDGLAARFPGLARRTLALRERAAVRTASREDADQPPSRRDARTLAETAALHAAAEQVRDAAAIAAYGGGFTAVEDAAWAIFRSVAVRMGFARFVWAQAIRPAEELGVRIIDVHAGWRHRLDRLEAPDCVWDPREPAERIPRSHPGLYEELRSIADQPAAYDNGLHPDAVALDPLSETEERVLSGEALGPSGQKRRREWRRFADLPVETYLADIEAEVKRVTAGVTEVLGRPPSHREELADVLLDRGREIVRALFGEGGSRTPWIGRAKLATVVEYTYIQHGWHREHPAVPGVLRGPGDHPLNLSEMDGPELRKVLIEAGARI